MSVSIRNHPDKRRRNRNVAHAWWDKRVTRYLRKNFKGKERGGLEKLYLAFCEIESDFSEKIEEGYETKIHGLLSTCATYAGMNRTTA